MKHSPVKQNIIETASTLFYKNGYNSTGINEIISKSKIAKATLYSHFRSKEDICIEYLRYKNDAFVQDIEAYCTSKPEGKAQVMAIFDFLLSFFKDKDFNGCWCIKTIAEIPIDNTKIRNEIQQQKIAFINFIADLIKNNLEDKSKKETQSLAKQVYLLYESAVAESHLHQEDWPIKEAKKIGTIILENK